jgi:hypothetical protein
MCLPVKPYKVGGLTFAEIEPCVEHEDGQGWWFGFDFAHAGDASFDPAVDRAILSPRAADMVDIMRSIASQFPGARREHYWTQAEAERECELLAEQLAAAA